MSKLDKLDPRPVNALDSILFAETDNQRWLRQASEKLERDRQSIREEVDRD